MSKDLFVFNADVVVDYWEDDYGYHRKLTTPRKLTFLMEGWLVKNPDKTYSVNPFADYQCRSYNYFGNWFKGKELSNIRNLCRQ